ncbi:hypothetical protein F383_37715 [Gossypium arboreum]|uniref:Uncharacterized protein n=1 Tax=Gossypium arboreum TaxID=29729 RepID=A0A0B0MD29_GOSAR|nr:hypothetical protein F383_37715 [Gossypium arboreum]
MAHLPGAGVLALGYGWCVKAVWRCTGGRTEACWRLGLRRSLLLGFCPVF